MICGGGGWLLGTVMRIVLAVIIAVLLALPASAQRTHGKQPKTKGDQSQSVEQQKKKRDAEQAYQKALKSIPDQPPPDPWKNVR